MAEDIVGKENDRVLGRDAQRNNILAARVISETVKTTLGPKGMDKMLVDRAGNVVVTNDGVTILDEMDIEHPAAKMIVEIAKTQEREVGDGTTTAVMLAGKFLENAEKLLDMKIHPTVITRGYRWAEEKAQDILKGLASDISSKDELVKIASTAMNGKGVEYLREKVEQIKESGANVVFVQKGVDEMVQHYLAREGVYAVRRIPRTDMQNLAKATGARIVSKLSEISSEDLGSADLVEERKDGEDAMTYILGCSNPKAITILIRGGTEHIVDEVERAVEDALGDVSAALKDSKIVAGGGAVEVEVSRQLREYAKGLTGRERLAVEEFASALEFIPTTLSENAGLDPIDVLTELRAAHDRGSKDFGLNLFSGGIEDNMANGVIEPLKVKTQAVGSATEVAIMILRIDDVIAARKNGGAGGNVGGMAGYD